MIEPDPRRNNGPFQDANEALKQFAATTFGIPQTTPTERLLDLVLGEALLMTDTEPSDFELDYTKTSHEQHADAIQIQIFAAWIIRAHLAGIEKGRSELKVDLETGEVAGEQDETDYLLSDPANAAHLRKGIAELNAGRGVVRDPFEQAVE